MNRPDWKFAFPARPKPPWYESALDGLAERVGENLQTYAQVPGLRFSVTLIQTHTFNNACEFRVNYISVVGEADIATVEVIDHVAFFKRGKVIRWEQFETAALEPIETNWMKENWAKHWVTLYPVKTTITPMEF